MSPQVPLALPGGLLGGVALGAVFLLLARKAGRAENLVLASGLLVAALIYLAFAISGQAPPRELRLEIVGLVVFTPLALAGARWWPPLLGIGWLMHAGWDILLHWPPQAWVPGLYPVFCVAFDLVVAAYFLFLFALPRNAGDSA